MLTFLKVLLLIALAPVVVALTIVVGVCRFIVLLAGMILGAISKIIGGLGVLGVVAMLVLNHGHFDHTMIVPVVCVFVLAFAISPFGLPLLAGFLVELLDLLNGAIKSLYSSDFLFPYRFRASEYDEYSNEGGEWEGNAGDTRHYWEQNQYSEPEHDDQEIPTCFQVLGFSHIPVSIDDVKKKYRRLAKVAHPDAGGDDEQMSVINNAYEQAMEYLK